MGHISICIAQKLKKRNMIIHNTSKIEIKKLVEEKAEFRC